MAQRSWSELVEEGRKLLKAEGDLKWHWADLALEVEPMGKLGANTGSRARLEKWAKEVGILAPDGTEAGESITFKTLLEYRETANAWPEPERSGSAAFSVHHRLRWRDDRFELIKKVKTVDQARKAMGTRPSQIPPEERAATAEQVKAALTADPKVAETIMADPQVRHVIDEATPVEERAERTSRALRDPSVARRVVEDSGVRSSMARAAKEMEDQSDQRQRERAPGLVGMSDFYQATGELSRMRQAGMKSLDAMRRVDLADDQRESLKEDHERVKFVSEWIDSYLESGDHSFDKELDALLREET